MIRVVRLKIFCTILFLSCVCVTRLSIANQADAYNNQDLFDMSIERLMEVPIVSASRQEQSIYELSVPVTVISAEDIHYSGLSSIPEILRFATGVDVWRLDRSRYIVGVRGFHSSFSDRSVVLVNGRTALNPIFGSPDWMELPVLVEDIERIEIVRGPGGAAWGANAFTGVINIITKRPSQTRGLLASTTINDDGDSYTYLRYGKTDGKFSWRVSAGYEDMEDSDAAGAGRMAYELPALALGLNASITEPRDFFRSYKFDTDFEYAYSDVTKLSFGAAHSYSEKGDRDLIGYFPRRDCLSSITRAYTKLDHKFDERTSGYLQWFGNFTVFHAPHMTDRYAYNENDLEGQVNFQPDDVHHLSLGGNLRWAHITSDNATTSGEVVFMDDTYDEYWAGVFLIDRMKLSDRLTIEAQGRIDRYNQTQTDWAARLAAIYALDAEKRHIVRTAFGRSFRAPGISLREATITGMGGLYNLRSLGKLHNENIYSLEAGYVGRFSDDVTFRFDTYYQRMEHLTGADTEVMLGIPPITTSTFRHVGGGNAYGAEGELELKLGKNALSAWYSYHHVDLDHHGQVVHCYLPARHKAGLTYRWFLDKNLVLNVNYSNTIFSESTATTDYGTVMYNPLEQTETFNRFDLTLSHKFLQGDGELMIGVTDLLNKTNPAGYDFTNFTSFETPGRTFFARVQLSF